jgi:hypothetical protein
MYNINEHICVDDIGITYHIYDEDIHVHPENKQRIVLEGGKFFHEGDDIT